MFVIAGDVLYFIWTTAKNVHWVLFSFLNCTDSGGSTSALMVVLKQRSERNFENICMINGNQVILLLRGSQDSSALPGGPIRL